MWGRIQYSLTFTLLMMVACADHHEGHDHLADPSSKNEPHHSHDEKDKACHKLSPHNADFAFALYKKLASHADAQGKNIFFSPLSISTALSMLALGAKGETHSQIFSTLRYKDLTPDQVNEGYEHLLHMLGQGHDNVLLETGGALAVQENFKLVDKFLKDIQHFYHGEAFSVDFSKPEIAQQEINKFIAKKTKDMITDMVKDLDQDAVLMLINYIYFKGKWEKPFPEENTNKADFHVDENTTVSVDMMASQDEAHSIYADRHNFTTVIKLPYDGNTSMVVVLPDKGKMEEVEKHINIEQLKYWMRKVSKLPVDVRMPKFSISASISLADTLKEMGMVDAFSDHADLSGISEGKLAVSKVLHKAVLNIDEKGTEAAGVTTIEVVFRSTVRRVIDLNRPFLVFVVNKNTRSILFMGKINNPSA